MKWNESVKYDAEAFWNGWSITNVWIDFPCLNQLPNVRKDLTSWQDVVLIQILHFKYLTIKDKGWKFDHCFILKDGVFVASDTYWQEPSYFVPSSVCIIIFYHHTVFEINNESWFSLKQPHKQESVFLSLWSGGELFHFVRKQCICDLR